MPAIIVPTAIEGLLEIQPRVFADARGYFLETWSERDLPLRFVQDNESCSRRGVLRGLHFQRLYPQGKLVRAVSGEVFDVAVDLRPGSPPGKMARVTLSGATQPALYPPASPTVSWCCQTRQCSPTSVPISTTPKTKGGSPGTTPTSASPGPTQA